MLLIYGKMDMTTRPIEVQRFCPICRAASTHEAAEVWRVPHVYGLTITEGVHAYDEATCKVCKARSGGPPHSLTRDDPNLHARLAYEERAMAGELDAHARRALLQEPFIALGYDFERRATGGIQQLLTIVLLVLTIIVTFIAVILWDEFRHDYYNKPLKYRAIGATVIGVWLLATLVWRVARRYERAARTDFSSYLALSLAGLNPRPDEIRATLETLRAARNHIAQATDADALILKVEDTRKTIFR